MLPGERQNQPLFTNEQLAQSMLQNYGVQQADHLGRPPLSDEQKEKELAGYKFLAEMYAGGVAGNLAWKGTKLGYGAAKGGITSLRAKNASKAGAPAVKGQGTVDDIFVGKPSYHGTSDPSRFERMGSKGNELGVQVPAPMQSPTYQYGRSPSFSVSSDYGFAKNFSEKYAGSGASSRVIPTVLDKKYANKILDSRNKSHKNYIAHEYKAEREIIKKDLFKKDGTLRNDRTLAQEKNTFDKATSKAVKDLDDWDKSNWEVMETVSERVKARGWKGYTSVEEGKLNLQVLDGKMIRGIKDKDTGQLMYNTPTALKELDEGGPVRDGIMTLPKPVNVRKKQVTVHKPSKSLKQQGFNPEVRLKAQYKNTSYIG